MRMIQEGKALVHVTLPQDMVAEVTRRRDEFGVPCATQVLMWARAGYEASLMGMRTPSGASLAGEDKATYGKDKPE